jgi:CheY-like chemotaxis protein
MTAFAPRPRILVVDPSDDTRTLYRVVFEANAWDVTEAANGRDAMRMAIETRPAVIVSEARLPILDGCDLCLRLRSAAETRGIGIVIVTGDAHSCARARAAGADAVSLKPCLPAAVAGQVRRLLAARRPDRREC